MGSDHAPVVAQDIAVQVHDLARVGSTWAQLLDHRSVVAVRDKAVVLAVGLVRHRQPVLRRQRPRFGLGRQMAQGKTQVGQLSGVVENRK